MISIDGDTLSVPSLSSKPFYIEESVEKKEATSKRQDAVLEDFPKRIPKRLKVHSSILLDQCLNKFSGNCRPKRN